MNKFELQITSISDIKIEVSKEQDNEHSADKIKELRKGIHSNVPFYL